MRCNALRGFPCGSGFCQIHARCECAILPNNAINREQNAEIRRGLCVLNFILLRLFGFSSELYRWY